MTIPLVLRLLIPSVTTGVFADATSDDDHFLRNLTLSDDGVHVTDRGSSNCWIERKGFATGTVPTGGCQSCR